jgi:hypothetical protein
MDIELLANERQFINMLHSTCLKTVHILRILALKILSRSFDSAALTLLTNNNHLFVYGGQET